MTLAEKGKRTYYTLYKNDRVAQSNKTVKNALQSLLDKKMIQGSQEKGGRRRIFYVLTEKGAMQAIELGAPARAALSKLIELYPEKSNGYRFIIDMAEEIGEENLKELARKFISFKEGELHLTGLPKQTKFAKGFIRAAYKHPRMRKEVTKIQKSYIEAFKELERIMQNSGDDPKKVLGEISQRREKYLNDFERTLDEMGINHEPHVKALRKVLDKLGRRARGESSRRMSPRSPN